MAFGTGNDSVNYEKNYSAFKNKNKSNLIKANCNCHVIHNAEKNFIKHLKYDIEPLVSKKI